MRSSAVIALAGLSALASAQSAPSSTACPAQNIVDACLAGYQDRIRNCQAKSNDWVCLCDVYTDVLQCYINCPDSSAKSPVQNQVTQYCNAAAPLKSAISASLASAASTRPPVSSPTAPTTTLSMTTNASSSPTSSATNAKGAADAVVVPVGGVLAVLLGVVGLL